MIKNKEFREKIQDIVSGQVLFDEPMHLYTSMGVGGKADILVSPGSIEELQKTILYLVKCNVPFVPAGNCTNLIVRDGGYKGAVISLKRLEKTVLKKGEGGYVYLYAETGVSLSSLVELSIRESLSGIEFCAGIPGSVGGGMKMNAGAYGEELKDVVKKISLINGRGTIKEAGRDDLMFEYRNLILPEGNVIVSAVFGLQAGSKEKIQEKVSDIIDRRKKKHPLAYRSAGSVFKNPENVPAGKIIDEVGLKGFQIGDAKISEIHGNFIVNLGKAKAKDITLLIEMIRKRVLEEKGITLDPEIKIIGEE